MKNKLGKILILGLLTTVVATFYVAMTAQVALAATAATCATGTASFSVPADGSFIKTGYILMISRNGGCIDDINVYWGKRSVDSAVSCATVSTWTNYSTISSPGVSANPLPALADASDYCFRLKSDSLSDGRTTDITIDNTIPVPTAANISTSGATGTGGAFKIGDTVTAVWDASATGDNDANMSGTNGTVTMNLSEFGGGASVSAVDDGSACGDTAGDKKWTACYTIAAGSIDSTTADAIIASATDAAGNVATTPPVTGIENKTVDNRAPVITAGKISIAGASGNGGAYIIGDTVTVTWDASTEATPDIISSVSVNFSQFDGLASSPGFDDGSSCGDALPAGNNIWTACYVITAGSINNVGSKNVSVLATDNAGNIAAPVSDDTNATVDDVSPIGTVTLGTAMIKESDLVQEVTVTYGEPMDAISIPTITFANNTGAIASAGAGAWSGGNTIWTQNFNVTDANEDTVLTPPSVTADSSVATDASGNAEGADIQGTFDIDTAAPVISVAGTVTLTVDINSDGFASIGDTLTYAAGTPATADGDAWTVDLSAYGLSATAAPGAHLVIADNDDGAFSATETVTDNVGNTKTGSVTLSGFTNIDDIAPTVTDGAISITSTGSGTGGAYVTGNTVTVQWDDVVDSNVSGGETLFSVTADFSQFGGGATVVATDSNPACGDVTVDSKWTACYPIVAGSIDATNLNVSVTVKDNAKNSTTTADTSNLTLDNQSPLITAANIGLSGGAGTGGAYKIGDIVKATWNATADGNSDIASLAVSFVGFGGGSVAAGDAGGVCDSTASDGIWSACYTNIAGIIDAPNINVGLTATDNASNATGPVSGTNNATVDNEAPNITANGTLSISTDNGVALVAALNNGTSTQDKVTQSAVTMTDADALTNVTTIDLTGLTGEPALAVATASGVVIPGALDNAAQTFTITVTDNAGNTSTTASDAISVDNIAPIITASGTVTVTTNNLGGANAAIGDGVTFNVGTVSVADTDTWTANMLAITGVNPRTSGVEDLVIAGAIDSATYAVTEIVTDNAGNITTDSTSTFDVDNIAPIVTAANIALSGATGTGGAYKIGDIVKATWNASADGNGDITAPVAVDFTVFGGGSVAANDSATGCDTTSGDGIWSACYTNIAGAIDATNVNVTFSATDNAGNATGPVTDDTNATVDNQAPNITAPGTLNITTDNGVVGVAALNNGSNQDKVTQSAVTLSVSDTDVTTIDLTALTGQAAVAATVESGVVIPGALDNGGQTFTITVTDNAGNASTTTSTSISVDNVAPVVSFASITVAGATGTGGAFKNADAPTLTWNATTSPELDTISAVSFDGSKFKAGDTALVGAGGPIWTASLSGAMDAQDDTGNDITATVTDNGGNISGPVTSSTAYIVDTNLPTVTGANIYVTGATGTAGAVKFGDTPVLTWSQTGDSEADTIASATFNGSSFKAGDTARSGSLAGGLWTAGLSGSADLQDTVGNTITVTVVDDVGNSTGPITSTPTYTIDTIVPVVTGGNITVTGATGAAGVFIIGDTPSLRWNQAANGETDTIASATFDGSSFKTVDTALSGVYGAPSWTTGLSGAMDAQETTGNSITATVVDDAGNSTGPISSTATYSIDTVAPTLNPVSIASSNANPSLASIGNTVTLSFTGSENLQTSPVVTFASGGNAVTGGVTVLGGPTAWTASYMVNAADTRGNVTFTIDFDDTPGNAGTQVTSTTDASSIIVVNSSVVFTDPEAGTVSSPFTVSVDTTQTTTSCRQGTTPFSTPYTAYGTLMTASGGTGYTINVTAVDGPITIHVVCLDENGNLSTDQSRSFTVSTDVTAPAVPVITTGTATVNADFYTIFGTAGADTPNDTVRTIQVYNGATLVGTVDVPVGQTGWSVVVPLTQSATNSFTAKSTDIYGNTSAASVAVVITEDPGLDVTAPAVPVITTGTATVNSDFYTIVGTAGADTPSDTVRTIQVYKSATLVGTVDVPVGQTDWSVVIPLTQSSANSLSATSTDVYGNTSAASVAVVITEDPTAGADVTAPAVPVITTGTATVNADFYTIVGTAGADTPNDTVRSIQVYNGATLAGTVNVSIGQTDWSVVVPLTQSSANSFTAISTDAFGNASAASVAVVITENPGLDVTAPAVPVIANGTATVNADVYLIFGTAGADTPNDTVRTIRVYEGASLVGTVDVPVGQTDWSVVVPLAQSSVNNFTATSTDFYGNTSAASVAVVITEDPGLDVTAPAVPVITTGTATVNSDFYTIVGTAGADTPSDTVRTVQVYESATLVGTVDVPVGQTDWSVVVPLTQSSANTLSATSTDVYGNTSVASVAVVITENPTAGADVTAPAVPVITTGTATVNADFYTIVGTAGADTPNDTVRSIQVYNGATLAGTVNVSIGQTDWSVVVPLTQSSANNFTAISTDAYGNTSAASVAVVITENPTAGADVTAPAVPVITNGATTVDADFYSIFGTAGADTPNDTVRTIQVYEGASLVGTVDVPVGQTDWSVVVPLSQSSANSFTATSTDVYGNISAASGAVVITEATAADTTAPVTTIVTPIASTTTGTSTTLQVTTDEAANCEYNIGGAFLYGAGTAFTTTGNISHSEALSALAGGINTVYVNCQDSSSNNLDVVNASVTFTVDNQVPDVTYAPIANQYNQSAVPANIGFTLSDDTGVTTLTLATDGGSPSDEYLASAGGTAYTLTLSSTLGQHEYVLIAGDVLGQTKTTTVSYLVVADTVTNVNITDFTVSGLTDTSITLDWTTDATASASVVDFFTSGSSALNQAAVIAVTDNSITYGGLTANKQYTVVMKSKVTGQTNYTTLTTMFTTAASNTGLSVDSIQMTKTYATADNTYANGWAWKFNVTVNDMSETLVAMKFAQWVSGSNLLSAGGNMQYSVDNGVTWTPIVTNATYGANVNVAAIDNDALSGGRQVEFLVQMKVPALTPGGSYSTSYGIQSL